MRFFLCFFLSLILACLCTGCKGKKVAVPEGEAEVQLVPMAYLVDSIMPADTAQQWTDIYMPFKLSTEAPEEMGVSGRALMIRGEAIHLSIRVMGMEGAVALIRQDSIFFVDKYHKVYLADRLGALIGKYEMTVADLQNLLLGRPFRPAATMEAISWGAISGDMATLTASVFDMPGMAECDCWFFTPEETPYGPMASVIDISLFPPTGEAPLLRASLGWSFGDAKFDTGREVKFTPPRGYQTIGIDQLASLLKQQ